MFLYVLEDGSFYLHNPLSAPFGETSRLRTGRLQAAELSALIASVGGLEHVRDLGGSYVTEGTFDAGRDVLLVEGMTVPIVCDSLCEGARPGPIMAALQEWLESVGPARSREVAGGDIRFVAQPLDALETPWELGSAIPPHEIALDVLDPGIRERGYLEPFDSELATDEAAAALDRVIQEHHASITSFETFLIDQTLYVRGIDGGPAYQVFFRDILPQAEQPDGRIEDIGLLPPVAE